MFINWQNDTFVSSNSIVLKMQIFNQTVPTTRRTPGIGDCKDGVFLPLYGQKLSCPYAAFPAMLESKLRVEHLF